MTAPNTLTYRRTKSGQWVVFGPRSMMIGEWVTVTKKDGTSRREHIESTGKPFAVDGVECCYGYPAPSVATIRQAGKPARRYTALRDGRREDGND